MRIKLKGKCIRCNISAEYSANIGWLKAGRSMTQPICVSTATFVDDTAGHIDHWLAESDTSTPKHRKWSKGHDNRMNKWHAQ